MTIPLNSLYNTGWYDSFEESSRISAREIVPIVLHLTEARSIVDVGCGCGVWLSVFKEYGIDECCGIDGAHIHQDRLLILKREFRKGDVCKPLRIDRTFDLAMCLEVIEHLAVEHGDTLLDSLVRLAPVIFFSAAIPIQGGTGHVNERWPRYWIERFRRRGFVVADCIRKAIWNNERVSFWYAQNAFLFVKQDRVKQYTRILKEARTNGLHELPIVHPRKHLEMARQLDRTLDVRVHRAVGSARSWLTSFIRHR